MRNQPVTYYVSFEAREYYHVQAREYGYRRIPRRIDAATTLPPGYAPYMTDSNYGIANFIAAISELTYEDTRDPLLQATDYARINSNPPLAPFWCDTSYRRYQWRLALSPQTRANLLAISQRHLILPIGDHTIINDNTTISFVLEAIGQYSLTPTKPIPVAKYKHAIRYDAGYPTRGGQSSLTSGYYLKVQ